MKLTSLSSYLGKGKKEKIRDFARKFDLELIFAKLPLQNLIPDRNIEEIIDGIMETGKFQSVSNIVSRLLEDSGPSSSKGMHKGELVLVEAAYPVNEAFSIHRPDGRKIPLISKGSYLGYRKPFEKLPLFDGTYHSATLFDFREVEQFDHLRVFLKEGPDTDPAAMLDSWDNTYARVIGLIGTCPPYICRVTTEGRKDESLYTSYGLFTLVIDSSPMEDLELAKRMLLWRNV